MRIVARELLDQEVSSDVESYFSKLIGDAFESPQADRNDVARVFEIVDAVLGDGVADENTTSFDALDTVLNTRLEMRASKMATAIREWIFDLVDKSEDHAAGAKHAAEWFQTRLRTLERAAMSSVSRAREQILAIKEAVLSEQASHRSAATGNRADTKWLSQVRIRVVDYSRLRLEHVIVCSVARWLRLVEGEVTATLDHVQDFWRHLNELAAKFHVTPSIDDALDHCAAPEIVNTHWRSLLGDLMKDRQQLVAALAQTIEQEIGVGSFTLRRFLTDDADVRTELAAPLREAARQVILRAMGDLNMSRLVDGAQTPASLNSGEFHRCVEAAKPNYLDESAASRLLLILPEGIGDECLGASLEQSNPPATIVRVTGGDLIVCQEVEQLHVRQVAAQLVDNRRDYIELAKRLHARVDVNWDDMSTGTPRRK